MRIAGLIAFLFLASCTTRQPSLPPGPHPINEPGGAVMRVHYIDVGQGDAALLEFPCAAMLVDTGGEQDESFDSTPALRAYLDAFFARRPDLGRTLQLLVISHPHIDHTRGVPMVLSNYHVQNIVDDGHDPHGAQNTPYPLHAFTRAHPEVGHRDIHLSDIPAGTGLTDAVIDLIACPGADPRIRALWGAVDSDLGWPNEVRFGRGPMENENNHSVVLRVDFGRASFLFSGDLEEHAIGTLVERERSSGLLNVDVYKVGHHGSWNGTTEALVAAMTPQVAVISMSPADRRGRFTAWTFGHPRKVTMDRLIKRLSGRRPPKDVLVAEGTEQFVPMHLEAAVYATGS